MSVLILSKLQSLRGQPGRQCGPLCIAEMPRPGKQVSEAVAEMGKDPGFWSPGPGTEQGASP